MQRYGSLATLVAAALEWGWDELDKMALAAQGAAEVADQSGAKAAQAVLKTLGELVSTLPMAALLAASLRHAHLRPRAAAWPSPPACLPRAHVTTRAPLSLPPPPPPLSGGGLSPTLTVNVMFSDQS